MDEREGDELGDLQPIGKSKPRIHEENQGEVAGYGRRWEEEVSEGAVEESERVGRSSFQGTAYLILNRGPPAGL